MAMRDDDKLVRQLSLIAFLMAQQRPVTADEIHEAVEGYGGMSEQAFLRRFYADRSEIESRGITLSVERPSDDPFQGDLYALPPENYYLPALDFDQAELSALQTCLYLLEGQFAYAEPLRLALQHLTLGRPSPLDDHAARTVSVNLLGGDYSQDVASHLTKIESAISRRKTVRFTYYSIGRDERSEREVDPYSLIYSGGSWYVVGYSHERSDTRLFRLSRIQGRVTFKTRAEHDFQPPADLDLSRYRDRAPWQLDDPVGTATIALSPTIAWWVEQMFGTYGDVEMAADGSARYTTPYASIHQLLTWVLSLGPDAEVIDPEQAREAAIDALALTAERHRAGATEEPPLASAVDESPIDDRTSAPDLADEPAPSTREEAREQGPSPDRVVPVDRFTRLLALMTRLLAACGDSAEAHVPVSELRKELNISKKVLEEDLGLLNLINFGGGCYALYAQIEDGTVVAQRDTYGDRFARPARLSPLEAKALAWAVEFVRDRLPIEAAQALRSAESKIDAAIGDQRPTVELNRIQVANESVADAVSRAIREDRVLEIRYWTESRGTITERAIEPHLLANARDAWYVDAFCRRAQARRTFRLDRIRSATLTDERFSRKSDVADPGPYLPFGTRRGEETVAQSASVWCSPQLARWMIEEHRPRERHVDGSALVEIPYASEDWLVRELLKHQGEAVLFEPVSLRRTVAERAEAVLERYGAHPPPPSRRRARTG